LQEQNRVHGTFAHTCATDNWRIKMFDIAISFWIFFVYEAGVCLPFALLLNNLFDFLIIEEVVTEMIPDDTSSVSSCKPRIDPKTVPLMRVVFRELFIGNWLLGTSTAHNVWNI
jgi:hypothetical protein